MRDPGTMGEGFDLRGERTPIRQLAVSVWQGHELVAILARKDFFVQYRRASFGMAWAVAMPLLQATILAIVVGRFVRFETVTAYPVFVYSGMLAWSFFNSAVARSSTSIVDNQAITTRIYFPRVLLPLMSVTAVLYGFLAGLPVLLGLLLVTGTGVGVAILWLVPGAALLIVLTTAIGATFSALHVYFRDIRFLVTAAMQPLFYATPVFYPLDALSGRLEQILVFNPVAGPIQIFRLAIGEPDVPLGPVWSSLAWLVIAAAVGLTLQSRRDRVFADLL